MKTFGGSKVDVGYSVQQTSDGGYIIAGCTGAWLPNGEVYLIKTDSQGSVLWEKTYGGQGAKSVQQTSDAGYIVVGDIDGDIYLIKVDAKEIYSGQKQLGEMRMNTGIQSNKHLMEDTLLLGVLVKVIILFI